MQSAVRLARCGFSGLEISAGHGHFFHQMLSPRSNVRDDEYGIDLEGRTRLLRELVSALRSACGHEFIIGLKLPGNDWIPGSIEPDYGRRLPDDSGMQRDLRIEVRHNRRRTGFEIPRF